SAPSLASPTPAAKFSRGCRPECPQNITQYFPVAERTARLSALVQRNRSRQRQRAFPIEIGNARAHPDGIARQIARINRQGKSIAGRCFHDAERLPGITCGFEAEDNTISAAMLIRPANAPLEQKLAGGVGRCLFQVARKFALAV